jgi:hypothetical protein
LKVHTSLTVYWVLNEINLLQLVGDLHPSSHVCGIDLAPIQPLWVPPNVEFIVDDCEKDWVTRNVDLAHFRFMAMILRDMPGVLGHAYE